MKRIISVLLTLCFIILIAGCNSSNTANRTKAKSKILYVKESNKPSLVKIVLYDEDEYDEDNSLTYIFNLTTDKVLTVKSKNSEKPKSNNNKSILISDKDYNEIIELLNKTKDFLDSDSFSEVSYLSKISIKGKKSIEFLYGGSYRSGYDQVLTKLIKISPIKIVDISNEDIKIDYGEDFDINEHKLNPGFDYNFDKKTKTLIISGKGEMNDYTPWIDNYKYIPKHIIVKHGITSICNDAFSASIDGNSGEPRYDTQFTESIILPSTVTKIGDSAFYYCKSIKTITLPKKLNKLGEMAFMECHSLKMIDIPDGVTKIKDSTFDNCEKLEEVKLGKRIKTIGISAFSNTNIKSIILPCTVKEIGAMAFYGCVKLKEIKISNVVKEIGDLAFLGCGMNSVTIPKSVKKIGEKAFGYRYDEKSDKNIPDKSFIIYGFKNTAAEKYAKKYGFTFIGI